MQKKHVPTQRLNAAGRFLPALNRTGLKVRHPVGILPDVYDETMKEKGKKGLGWVDALPCQGGGILILGHRCWTGAD